MGRNFGPVPGGSAFIFSFSTNCLGFTKVHTHQFYPVAFQARVEGYEGKRHKHSGNIMNWCCEKSIWERLCSGELLCPLRSGSCYYCYLQFNVCFHTQHSLSSLWHAISSFWNNLYKVRVALVQVPGTWGQLNRSEVSGELACGFPIRYWKTGSF